ncbi:MAG: hypothetical protein KGJ36_05715 [Acidobacteriota bacterium]|nr:hypothetical protein [Acidobacteriota bacterium]
MIVDAFLVPLKAFDLAKERLRTGNDLDVSALAAAMARDVIAACAPVPVLVVTESADVAAFATEAGAQVIVSRSRGLNDALRNAYRALGDRYAQVAVVPGDLRHPGGLGAFDASPGLTVVPDRHGTGTNLLALPGGLDFHFAYGPDSARRHLEEGRRLGLAVSLVTNGPWGVDVDRPEDLDIGPDGV